MSWQPSDARQPDILEVIADLSNDEVRTPPRIADAMLDLLPDEVWRDPTLRWLDPGCKTGVFPRQITRRLMDGLADVIPDRQERLDHILREQVFAIAITTLTAMMSRRTVYCSKDASSEFSVVQMPNPDGDIWFDRVEHSYDTRGKCQDCRATRDRVERDGHDNQAYAFIHDKGRRAVSEVIDMKFDIIVGNPPYQLSDGGHAASATSLYDLFVETAIELGAQHVLMVTPSRWFAGGKGLAGFRERMLTSRKLKSLTDYIVDKDAFPGVNINGGVSYFLWERDYAGNCAVTTVAPGGIRQPTVERPLDEFDVFVRRNEAVAILRRVLIRQAELGAADSRFDRLVSSRKPFGFPTNYHGVASPKRLDDPVKLYGSGKVTWVEREDIPQNRDWIDGWKVLVAAASDGNEIYPLPIWDAAGPFVAEPGEACTETYLVAARVGSEEEAQRVVSYMRTRFFRFLVSLRKVAQHNKRDNFAFVPDLPMDRDWTDEQLYERYDITESEQAHIAEMVKEMPS